MKFSNIAAALAASSLLMAPIAAQAGTRASGSAVYPAATYSANRASAAVAEENELAPSALIIILLAGGAAAFGIAKAIDSKSNGAD